MVSIMHNVNCHTSVAKVLMYPGDPDGTFPGSFLIYWSIWSKLIESVGKAEAWGKKS